MPELLPDVLRHLENLVAFDTRNPPRLIGTGGIFDYLRAQLPGFRCEVVDHGDGAVSLLAVRGNPRRVFNVHLDTVPSSEAWSADPHVLRVTHDRAIGLGACDIKGAAAALVAAAMRPSCSPRTRKPMIRAASPPSWRATTASWRRSSPSPRAARRCWRIAASARCC